MSNGYPRHIAGAGTGSIFHVPSRATPHRIPSLARVHDAACVQELPDGARIVAGNVGDHPLVLQLLVETQHAQLGEDFQSRLDEPTYRPGDRLLVRRDRALVAHVHVANHYGWFDGLRIPLVKFEDFVARPEFRHAGYEGALLNSAELIAASEGALLAVANANVSELFTQNGWSALRGQGHTRANARALLANLDAQRAARRKAAQVPLEIRTWRHFELDAIRAVYDHTAARLWGPLLRSEAAWQWMIGRKAQDQILIAVDAEDASPEDSAGDLLKAGGRVVGYAIVRGSAIVEMMSLPDFAAARTQLLARACQDAMDRDHNAISLYTPPADALHELFVMAGGAWMSDATSTGPQWVAKILAPEKWVERLFPMWNEQARLMAAPRPFDLGIVAGNERFRFTLTRRRSRLQRTQSLPPAWISCSRATMDSLLLGNLSLPEAVSRGCIQLSDANLAGPLAAVFPPRLFWQSALELMRL